MKRDICAVVPIKDFGLAKQRLAAALEPQVRRRLAMRMAEAVIKALAGAKQLAQILVVTADAEAAGLARRFGAQVTAEGALDGHTGSVAAAARLLAARKRSMLAISGDIPLLRADDIDELLAAHGAAPAFTICPATGDLGSNALVCSPADVIPLRFGENSFYPHLQAARARGIEPAVVRLPRVALDIDTPEDLALLRNHASAGADLLRACGL